MSDILETKRTTLFDLHLKHGAKMVPFAGYEMPLNYEMGIAKEHLYCREKAGLFDVSHMGQAELIAENFQIAAFALEQIVPSDLVGLKPGRLRYTVLLNEQGGVEDDLIVTHRIRDDGSSVLGLVVNASRKSHDYSYISAFLDDDVDLKINDDLALIALQGPLSETVMANWCKDAIAMPYMSEISAQFDDIPCRVSRSGYTGEDGFEISVHEKDVERLASILLDHDDVKFIGLGARDSLRLEAGFCLYGHDLDELTNPVEANLSWIIGKRRRQDGGFLADAQILHQLSNGPDKRRVGLLPVTRSAPAREGAEIYDIEGKKIGHITSGGFGPTVNGPIAMGYLKSKFSSLGTTVEIDIRGKRYEWRVSDLPFTPYRTNAAKKPTKH